MPLRTPATVLVAGALTGACVMVPVTTENFDPDCRVVTHHMELRAVQVAAFNACQGEGCQAVVIAALGVTAVSAIVSGSIVLAGNVAYWAEHRSNCPPSLAAAG
jgi:hypothetical protein